MATENPDNSNVIQFVLPTKVTSQSASSRDELAQMVRKVLSPQELFKMNAPKRKKSANSEIISFEMMAKEKQNG